MRRCRTYKVSPPTCARRSSNVGGDIRASGADGGHGGFDVTMASRMRNLYTGRGGPADVHAPFSTLWQLRETCRDHDRNSSLLHGILDRAVDNIVGPGWGWHPETDDEGWNEAAYELISADMKKCDLRGLMNFSEMMAVGLRARWTDGDFAWLRAKNNRIQAIEAGQLVNSVNYIGDGLALVNGVEVGEYDGQIKALWIADLDYRGMYTMLNAARRIPIADVLTYAPNLTRYTQTRGIPVLAACLDFYGRTDMLINSVMFSTYVNSCHSMAITRNPEYWAGAMTDADKKNVLGGDLQVTGSDGQRMDLDTISPGMIMGLLPGEGIESIKNEQPGNSIDPLLMLSVRMIGAAIGYPLELILMDFSQTNYSSARAALLCADQGFRREQSWCKNHMFTPYYNDRIMYHVGRRDLTPKPDMFKVNTFPPKRKWVDPLKEVLGHVEACKAGFESITEVLHDEGLTLKGYIVTRQKELDAFAAANIPTSTVTGMDAGTIKGEKPEKPEAGNRKPEPGKNNQQQQQEEDDEARAGGRRYEALVQAALKEDQ